MKEELIERKRYHVPETGRFRDFYFLTAEGMAKAKELQEEIGKRKIKVRHKDETKEIRIKSLFEYLRKIAKKPIEEGKSYLVKGEKPDKAYEILKDLLGEGHQGVVLTDVSPRIVKKEYKIKAEMYCFSEVEGENVLRPDRLEFEPMSVISDFLKENEKPVLMLEGFKYLSQMNNFDACLRWIKTVNDLVAKHEGVLILPINPTAFAVKELSLLLQSLTLYEPKEIVPVEINYTNIVKNITPEGLLDTRTILEPKRYVDYSERRPELKYFFGRKKELKEINDFIRAKSKILCIRGLAGIGKTASYLNL